MKKQAIVLIILIISLIGTMTFIREKEVLYKEGTYTGLGQGNHGEIKVEVTTNQYKIKEIKILEQEETPGLCDIVYDKIPKSVLKKNSADVEVVSGASYTSQGVIDAIKDAVNKAKLEKKERANEHY
jgi:uncharacterized protein with FMN-binding domain